MWKVWWYSTSYIGHGCSVPVGGSSVRFQERELKLHVSYTGVDVDLLDGYETSSKKLNRVQAQVKETVTIPALSEMFVLCKVDGVRCGKEYLIEPLQEDDEVVRSANAIVIPQMGNKVWIRVVNISAQDEKLYQGNFVASLHPGVCVLGPRQTKPFQQEGVEYTISDDLTEVQRKELEALIHEFQELMWMPGSALPLVDVGVEHTIEVKLDAIPKAFKPRRLSQSEMVEVRKEIEDLCKQGLIETSTSPWAAPIVLMCS